MAGRKNKEQAESGLPAWLITFSDLMTLLLTFFVLLLSMAVIDERSKRVVIGSLTRTFGSGEQIFNPLTEKTKETPTEPGVMEAERDDLAPLRDMLFDDVDKDLNFQENKYVQIFSINDRVLFRPGESTLSPEGVTLLDRVLPYLQRIEYPLLVAGHTSPLRDEHGGFGEKEDAFAMNGSWPISFHRARAVYRHLTERGIAPDRLSLEAFGQYRPRWSNNTPEGRQKNRRVDLVLDKRNREWIRKMEALRRKEPAKTKNLFYKGFKFDVSVPDAEAPRTDRDAGTGEVH
jgi:chemotaxis protein MotB